MTEQKTIEENYLVRKTATNKFYDVSETTQILSQYGISHNDKKTRDLISKNRLKARSKGKTPNDRRSGYEISEKWIYDLIIEEIPIMQHVLEELLSKKKPTTTPTPRKKNEPKKEEQKVQADS